MTSFSILLVWSKRKPSLAILRSKHHIYDSRSNGILPIYKISSKDRVSIKFMPILSQPEELNKSPHLKLWVKNAEVKHICIWVRRDHQNAVKP
jgi:hypothetical protein